MILHLIPTDVDGCLYHRVEVPMHNLKGFELAQTTVLDGVNDEDLQKCSLVVMSRDSAMYDVAGQIKRLKKFKIPYVVDIDDYWKLNKEHLAYDDFKKETRQRWEMLMKSADAVTTTTGRLAKKIENHNKNVVVVPNALDTNQPQWNLIEREIDIPVFGWVGGTHHIPDIEILKNTFLELHKDDKVWLALGGWTAENQVYHIFEHWMTNGGQYQKYKRIKGESVYNYGHLYDFIDVCIVPLLESAFTSCKSSLKIIEAGFKGKPCIASKVAPFIDDFTDKEVLFVDTRYDWYKAINTLHDNPEMLFSYKSSLMERVKDFEIKKVNHIREQLYTTLINGK